MLPDRGTPDARTLMVGSTLGLDRTWWENIMDRDLVARAWRDPVFRAGLSLETLLKLPAHPSGDSAEGDDPSNTVLDITLGGGCGTAGCSRVVCTDPCTRTNVVQCSNTTDAGGCRPMK